MKQFKILIQDPNGGKRYVIYDADNIEQAERMAIDQHGKVVAIVEIPASESLF